MEKIHIRYKFKKYHFEIPRNWNLLKFATFEESSEERNVESLTLSGIRNPINMEPLRDLVSPSDKIAIIIEDLTRPSPKDRILTSLLNELDYGGIPNDDITIIVSLGTHGKLGREDLKRAFGKEVVNSYRVINHDCHSPDLIPVCRLKSGREVKINRQVFEADFKIGIGSIFPHPMNGFGGGGKILFPGVADFDSILEHHLKYSFRAGSGLGQLKGNPFYEEVCNISETAGLDFIINSVLDHNDSLYDLVCGDPREAYIAGVGICKGILSKRFKKQADVTIVSAFPYSEGRQIMKPLAPASMVTKKGGCIVLFVDAVTTPPDILIDACEAFRMKHSPNLQDAVFEYFDGNRRIAEDAPPEINMAMAQALLAQDQFKVILVSGDISKEAAERIGFYHAGDPETAFEMISGLYPNPDVNVIPAGGVILPVLEENRVR